MICGLRLFVPWATIIYFAGAPIAAQCMVPDHQSTPEQESRSTVEKTAEEIGQAIEASFVAKHGIGDGCVPRLVDLLEENEDWRMAVVLMKRRACLSLLKPVEDLSKHSSGDVRVHAAEALAAMGGPSTLPALLRLVEDGDHAVREAAVQALCRVDRERCAGIAAKLAVGDDSAKVRALSVRLAGETGYRFAPGTWGKLLHDPDDRVVQEATHALTCDDLARPEILSRVSALARQRSGSRTLQSDAIVTLGRCRVSEASKTVIEVFVEEGRRIPARIGESLWEDPDFQLTWTKLVLAMVRCAGQDARAPLEQFANSHSSDPELAEVTIGNMPTPLVTAFEALGDVGGQSSVSSLKKGLGDPYVAVRFAALGAAAKLGLVSQLREVIENVSLKDTSEMARDEARRVLAEMSAQPQGL